MLDHSCQVQRHPHAMRGHDLYETPPCAVRALLAHEQLPPRIWEFCCGRGSIVRVLRAAGHEVYATDLIDYAAGEPADHYGRDFLKETVLPAGFEDALGLTNPPYKGVLPEKIIAHALDLCPKVIMLLRWAFYESHRRSSI